MAGFCKMPRGKEYLVNATLTKAVADTGFDEVSGMGGTFGYTS